MKKVTKGAMNELLAELRAVAPDRPLTYGESLQVGRLQAARLRRWAEADEPDINLIWLVEQRAVPVYFVPSHRLGEQSGLTTDQVNDRVEMFINQSEPPLRQRFSLLHELKHVLDFPAAELLHAKLGRGNRKLQANMIEWVANDFAAHVLMPTPIVKRLWGMYRDIATVANHFNVSTEAMGTRLERLNLIGEQPQRPRAYFRSVSLQAA